MNHSLPGSVHGILWNTGVDCHALLNGILPNPGIEYVSLTSPALAFRFFTTSATWEASLCWFNIKVLRLLVKIILN